MNPLSPLSSFVLLNHHDWKMTKPVRVPGPEDVPDADDASDVENASPRSGAVSSPASRRMTGPVPPAMESCLSAERIRQYGLDVSDRYLGEHSPYAVYQFNKRIYVLEKEGQHFYMAFRCAESEAAGARESLPFAGGAHGVVRRLGRHTVVKSFPSKGETSHEERHFLRQANECLIKDRFMLKALQIDDYFVTGLWNVEDTPRFEMPALSDAGKFRQDDEAYRKKWDAFICALKVFNDEGCFLPDFSVDMQQNTLHNACITDTHIVAIDLDYSSPSEQPRMAYLRQAEQCQKGGLHPGDQWLFHCNAGDLPAMIEIMRAAFDRRGVPLSSDKQTLARLYEDGLIRLPLPIARTLPMGFQAGRCGV